ncbi:sugar ABC transporter substrate-binding protein [Variovorax sp. J22P240]|uniref:sugar ABC transporter substrate-binding protein n=1 Tax=Variovorax sp. J22P240 TaxID=3053514 RepID=UPI002578DBBD|nr:sugar ABC transporter substrate-binding protein [Variovorax sp. J22P240]MDM0002822.1 sugar ABC transporter substrate-binding protein [Variovorax sp. J22P240]
MEHLRIITKNHTNPAYGGALVGARTVAQRMGCTLDHRAPEMADSPEQQSALIDQAIVGRPDAIILLPAHASAINDAIARVNAADIPLVLFVSEPTAGRWVGFIGSDDTRMAAALAHTVLPRLRPDAKVAIIEGHPGSITTPQRREGFEQALAQYADMQLVDVVSGYYQHAPGREAALTLLSRHARLDAILSANDLMAMGALEAFAQTGRRVPMVSINGTPDAVAAVRAGTLAATASFNTHRFGCLAVEMALRHLRGERVARRIDLAPDIIDAGNAAEWDRPYEQRVCPDWDQVVASEAGSQIA